MKRVICIILSVCMIFFFCSCGQDKNTNAQKEKVSGVWFSYSELDSMLLNGDFKENFLNAIEKCSGFNITDVFIHIRPFCDSIYPSNFYPLRESVKDKEYDVLEYIIDICHKKDIRVHAWINPYRVTSTTVNVTELPDDCPAKIWLTDKESQNDTNVCLLDGIYLNPSSVGATRLITDGIREVVEKYDIDGLHFDDYFYPTESYDFDKISYEEYSNNAKNPMSHYDWRRANINAFISSVKNILDYQNKDIIFSISPSASIEKNYNSYYADIEFWLNNNLVDWIIPQLYFGFSYPDKNFCFDELFESWENISAKSDAKLIIGLASYKIDIQNDIELEEWSRGDLLKREIEYAQNDADGFCFFSYTSLFGNSENQVKERENIGFTEFFNSHS